MGMEPCDVGPVEHADWCMRFGVNPDTPCTCSTASPGVWAIMNAAEAERRKRHHPNGIEPPDEERDRRAQRRAAERNLMDFYDSLPTYISACDAMKPSTAPDYTEAGETFARLIAKG